MFQLILVHFALAATAFSVQATAAVPTTAQTDKVQGAAAAAGDQKVCRRAIATGSIMAKRVCKTQAEWNAETRHSQDTMRRVQSGGHGN